MKRFIEVGRPTVCGDARVSPCTWMCKERPSDVGRLGESLRKGLFVRGQRSDVRPALTRIVALAVYLLAAGCSQLGGPVATKPADTASEAGAQQAVNPYLQHKVDVPRQAQVLFSQALEAMQAEQWTKAEVILQGLTVDFPTLSGPWLNLGIVYRNSDRQSQAEEAFQRAIAANRYNLDAYNQLAVLKRERGDFSGAEALYLKALDIWPQHTDTHRNLGILYDLYLGQFDKAIVHFETYQSLLDQPDKQVAGWLIDLKRRMQEVAKQP